MVTTELRTQNIVSEYRALLIVCYQRLNIISVRTTKTYGFYIQHVL